MQPSHYIHSLTPLRGIAALWVVLFHIDVSLFYRDLGALLPRTSTGIFSQGYLWVDFFFLLSGFIIAHVYGARLQAAHKPAAIKEYLWARFARIYPLHLFTLLLLILSTPFIAYFFPQVVDGSWETYFAASAIPSQLLFVNAMNQHVYLSWNMVSWSIGAEWWTYVAALVLVIGLWKKPVWLIFSVVALALIGLCLLVYLLPGRNLDITFNYGFLRCLFEFIIGLGVYQFYINSWGKAWLKWDSVFVLLMLAIALMFHFQVVDLFIVPVFVLLLLAASYNHSRIYTLLNKPVFQYIGTISYSIYLIHGLWFFVFWFTFPLIKTDFALEQLPALFKLIYVVVFLVLTLISAHFSYRYVEVPGRRWFRPRAVRKELSAELQP